MAKLTPEQKRERIRDLERAIAEAEREILEILEVPKPTEPATPPLPKDFSLNERIFNLIKGSPEGIEKAEIISAIHKDTGVAITPLQAQSALAYLKNSKEQIEIIGRGKYRAKQL